MEILRGSRKNAPSNILDILNRLTFSNKFVLMYVLYTQCWLHPQPGFCPVFQRSQPLTEASFAPQSVVSLLNTLLPSSFSASKKRHPRSELHDRTHSRKDTTGLVTVGLRESLRSAVSEDTHPPNLQRNISRQLPWGTLAGRLWLQRVVGALCKGDRPEYVLWCIWSCQAATPCDDREALW